jgi:hypothetical protein
VNRWVVVIGKVPESTLVSYGDKVVGHLASVSLRQDSKGKTSVMLELNPEATDVLLPGEKRPPEDS